MNSTSVVETLKAAGLYKDTGRIEEQMLVTILPNGERAEHKMAEIDYYDIKTMADELDVALRLANPLIQSLYAKNAVAIVNAIRVVNVETASGFKGAVGAGRQLDMLLLRAEQFQDPGAGATTPRSTWLRASAAAATVAFIQSTTDTNVALAMATTEALLLFGFVNPSATPSTSAVQVTYLAQAMNIQNLSFELAQAFSGYPLCELKEPVIVYPQETILIQTYYYQATNDETWPIGLWVKMSQNLRALGTS